MVAMFIAVNLVLWSVCYMQQVRSNELQCRLKPGCHISKCDPSPLQSVATWLHNKEFPISCQNQSEDAKNRDVLEKKMSKLERELEDLKATVAKLTNTAKPATDFGSVKCIQPGDIEGGEIRCTKKDYTVGTICTAKCKEGREVMGSNDIVCNKDGRWSHKLPKCACSKCKTGKDCNVSISWLETQKNLKARTSYTDEHYGGKVFECEAEYGHACTCVDKNTREWMRCRGKYISYAAACDYAASKLIRRMVKLKLYPPPCDEEYMRPDC